MTLSPKHTLLIPIEPSDIPGLISFWNFTQSGDTFTAQQGEPYTLRAATGALGVVEDPAASFGGTALYLEEGQWLSIPRAECPRLDIHGPGAGLTVMAWIRLGRPPPATANLSLASGTRPTAAVNMVSF